MKQYMITFQNKKEERVYLFAHEKTFADAYRSAIEYQIIQKDLEIITIRRCIQREKRK